MAAAAAAATMAAFRRVAALAGKLNLWSAARNEFVSGQTASGGRARRCLAAGMCVAAGGAVALYLYNDMTSGRGRKRGSRSINGLLPSIPTVEAKEKVGDVLNWRFIGNNKALVRSSDLVGSLAENVSSSVWGLGVEDTGVKTTDCRAKGQRALISQSPSAKFRATELQSVYFCFVAMVMAGNLYVSSQADKLSLVIPSTPSGNSSLTVWL